jgi:hypothetical protein
LKTPLLKQTSLRPTVEETLPSPKKLLLKQTKVDLQGHMIVWGWLSAQSTSQTREEKL